MENGAQALHLASRNGYRKIAELLIDAGASVKARNSDDARPLHRAARYDKAEMVEFLISKYEVLIKILSFSTTRFFFVLLEGPSSTQQTRTALRP